MKKLILIFMVVFLIGIGSAAFNSTLKSGLTSYWNFDETSGLTAEDSVDGDSDGTLRNMSGTEWTSGLIGNGLKFDGVDDVVSFTYGADDWDWMDFSISFWIKSSTAGGDLFEREPGHVAGYYTFRNHNASHARWSSKNESDVIKTIYPEAYWDNEWHHIVITRDESADNLTVWIDGALNVTGNSTRGLINGSQSLGPHIGSNRGTNSFSDGLYDEMGIWNRTLTGSEINWLYNGGSGLGLGLVTINLTHPTNNTGLYLTDNFFSATFNTSDTLANSTLTIWDSTGAVFNTTTSVLTGTTNTSNITVTPLSVGGNQKWNFKACTTANECSSADNRTFSANPFLVTGEAYNSTTFDTARETFKINVTGNTSTISAKLFYNGVDKGAGTNAGNNSHAQFSKAIDIPTVTSNTTKSFTWQITMGDSISNYTSLTHTIYLTIFRSCNSSISDKYLNFTFLNETTSEEGINASISSSTWKYWLGSGDTFKTLSYSNSTEGFHSLCSNVVTRDIRANVSLSYTNSISEQRTWIDTFSMTNATKAQTLYLLPSSEGIFVTFQLINSAEQTEDDVLANATKSGNLIQSGLTDDAGLITFFLDPDTSYTFNFFKTGFDLFTTTLTPTQTSYTINLGTSTISSAPDDFTKGVTYTIYPLTSVALTNQSFIPFNFSISSSFWSVTEFGFTLFNSSGHYLNSTSVSAASGTASALANTSGYKKITMNYYWVVSGNYTNGTVSWVVFDSSGTGYGINNFLTRLKSYFSGGIFGSDNNFSLAIFAFIVVLLFTGIMSFKFGVTDSRVITGILLGIVFFFDVGLGLFPKQGLATVMLFIVAIAIWIKEGIR